MSAGRAASIQSGVTRRLLLGALLTGIVANTIIYGLLRGAVIEQFDASLEGRARALASVVVAQSVDGPLIFPNAGGEQPEFKRRPGRADYFEIWDGQGRVVARSPSLSADQDLAVANPFVDDADNEDYEPDPDHPSRLPTSADCVYEARLPDGRSGHCIEVRFTPYVADGSATQASDRPKARIVLATASDELDETLNDSIETLGIGAVAMAGLATVIVVVVVRRGLEPLRRLAEDASQVDVDHLEAFRFEDADLPAELRPIAQRLNDLLSRLAAAFARERRFTADAAHELRTPIAELRALSEVALRYPPTTAGEHEANYQNLLGGARQMEAIVDALLTLARHHTRNGTDRVPADRQSLADLVEHAWPAHAEAAAARGVTLTTRISDDCVIEADRALLLALLHNLFSNVASYAARGTTATVVGSAGRLVISNAQNTLSAEDLPHLARPFWRKDASRTDRESHTGLGLTLVKEYADALGLSCAFAVDASRFAVTLRWSATQKVRPADGVSPSRVADPAAQA